MVIHVEGRRPISRTLLLNLSGKLAHSTGSSLDKRIQDFQDLLEELDGSILSTNTNKQTTLTVLITNNFMCLT